MHLYIHINGVEERSFIVKNLITQKKWWNLKILFFTNIVITGQDKNYQLKIGKMWWTRYHRVSKVSPYKLWIVKGKLQLYSGGMWLSKT